MPPTLIGWRTDHGNQRVEEGRVGAREGTEPEGGGERRDVLRSPPSPTRLPRGLVSSKAENVIPSSFGLTV